MKIPIKNTGIPMNDRIPIGSPNKAARINRALAIVVMRVAVLFTGSGFVG